MRLFATLLERERTRFTANPRLFLWQMCWSPIWVGSNGPAPRLGQRAEVPGWAAREEERSGADAFIHGNLGRLAFRFWISLLVGSILRGIWLALLVVTGWAVLALAGLVGLPSMLAIAGLTVLGAVAGAAYGFLHPIEPAIVAVMLDRTFGLDERLTTAIDRQAARVRDTASPTLPQLQLADAANILAEVMHELPRAVFFPVREAIALLVVTLALLTALFAHVPDRPLPGIAAAPVPRFVPASERLANPQVGDQPLATTPEEPAPSVSEVQQQAQAAQQAREDLGVLGEALDDHPITQGASDAIAAGDYPAASDMIRASAADAPNASPEEREALADDLDVAADQIAPTNPNLADSSREAAGDLRQGGSQAGDGLDGLADTVDQTAGVVEPEDQAAPGEEASQEGNPGAAQPGAAGQESASSGDAQQGSESSQSSSGASNQSQQPAGDPGEGVAAEPGVANQELQEPNAGGDEAGEMSGASSSGQAQAGAGGAPDPEGAGGAPGSDQAGQEQPAANGASQGGSASDTESQGLQGAPDDETSASQGSGAGTGQSGANDQTRGSQEVGDPAAPGESEGAAPPSVDEAGDPPPGNGGGDGSAGEVGEVGGTNSLSLQGTSDEGVRTGGTSGSSSVGSGAGSGAASGDQVQQQVGVAGPDANRIPDGMQDIVQDFFTEPGTQP
jgi:uncharacterized membrane protein